MTKRGGAADDESEGASIGSGGRRWVVRSGCDEEGRKRNRARVGERREEPYGPGEAFAGVIRHSGEAETLTGAYRSRATPARFS